MPRPYILAHNDKWFVFVGCSLIALCTTKIEALEVQRDWIRKGQAADLDALLPTVMLPDRSPTVLENGVN
jgi:hypothetical protein